MADFDPQHTVHRPDLRLVPPGAVDSRERRPDWAEPVRLPPRDGQVIAGVARIS